jgi:glyoxylase-like metal-dependent hydrolase (beta-lactamase superfamily II)
MERRKFGLPDRHQRWTGILASIMITLTAIPHLGRRGTTEVAAAFPQPAPPLVPYPIHLGSGIYLLGGLQPSAAYVVETGEGLVLVDAGLQSDANLLKSQMARLNLDWTQIRAIFLTHCHWDHCGGAEHLRAVTGARVHAGRGDAAVLRKGGPAEALYSAFSLPPEADFHPTTVDVELKGGESIAFGDVRFRALAVPGHTPGSMGYLMERDNFRALFTGDVISMLVGDEKSHLRIWKPLGTYSAYLPPRFRGDARAYLASLRELRALPPPDLVLPGHPRADPTPQEPRLPRERWESMLDRGIAEMASLAARYEADGADFLDGEPKQLMPGLYYLGDFHGHAVYGLFAASRFYLVDAPGGPGLLSFLHKQFAQLGLKSVKPAAVLLTSCDPDSVAGLGDLVRDCHPEVVVPPGLETVNDWCPRGTALLPAAELPARGWFEVTALPLRGPLVDRIAYRLGWAGKTVLFSGQIPIGRDAPANARLRSTISRSRQDTLDFLMSVFRLRDPKPDLWLPAFPVDGQNANLYDQQWEETLDYNYRLGYRTLTGRR